MVANNYWSLTSISSSTSLTKKEESVCSVTVATKHVIKQMQTINRFKMSNLLAVIAQIG